MRLRIRIKLLAAFGSILLLSVLLIAFSISSINTILGYKEINEEVDALKLHLETLDLTVEEFIHEGYRSESFLESQKSPAIDAFQSSYTHSKAIIERIEDSDLAEGTKGHTVGLLGTFDSLATEFKSLVELLKKRGFRDHGSEGALRSAIHQVENSGFNIDKVAMLTLRRHEKDFFLRKDLHYQEEFNTRIGEFRDQLKTDPALTGLIPVLGNYQTEFNNVVEIEKKIGLKSDEGIRGRIRKHFEKIRPQLDEFRAQIKERNEAQIFQTKVILGILFAVQIIAGLLMAIVYANLLTKSIQEIRDVMQKLATGIFPEKLDVRSTEEIGQTKLAFNQFVDRLKAATTFAAHMGVGNQIASYDTRFSDDVLAHSLINAQEKLIEAEAKQSKINWTNQGVAAFNDILKNEADQIRSLADKILKLLVEYLQANQGALYRVVKTDSEQYLERTATYAYSKKKYENQRIEIGEGTVGQCVQEGSSIYLKEIPKDFVKITSGLGASTPRNVLVVPLKIRAIVMGAVELASFRVFEGYQIEFTERIAENIATILSNKQTAEETKRLLEESQQRASALAQQEEEMRQNAEELAATQEEMERQRNALEEEIRQLRRQLEAIGQRTYA